MFAQRSLAELGSTNVRSLAGGFSGWKKAGQPWETPKTLRADQDVRYSRHVLLPEVGLAGQTKLLASKVVCIGAGGLGSPSSMYLAAAGVGTLGMIDDDTVDVSNLQRQILHGTDRLGIAKVDSAERTLKNLNPDVRVDKHRVRLSSHNALELLATHGDGAKLLSGGQSLMPAMNLRLISPDFIVDISEIAELRGIGCGVMLIGGTVLRLLIGPALGVVYFALRLV